MKRPIKIDLIKWYNVAGMLVEAAELSTASWETILRGPLAFLTIWEPEALMAFFWGCFSRIFFFQ